MASGERGCRGQNFGITAGGGGGCVLVLPDQKGVAKVVPNGRTLKSLIDLSFSKIVGERT
jgi:hypothetical protein